MSGLVVSNLIVTAGGRTILSEVSCSAPAGAITGLIGPNGAGKSTLLAAILGLRRRRRGSIKLDDLDLPGMPAAERAKRCAYVEQFATTPERLTVRDVVALGRLPFQSAWQTSPTQHDEAVIADALAQLGITHFTSRLYHSLSGGEQQRVQIARALAQEPVLLLLDEPTSHLDIKAQLQVFELLRRLAAKGCTVVLAVHDLNLAARYCDHLVALQSGQVAGEGKPSSLLTPELLGQVYDVRATITQLPGTLYPTVIYDPLETGHAAAKTD